MRKITASLIIKYLIEEIKWKHAYGYEELTIQSCFELNLKYNKPSLRVLYTDEDILEMRSCELRYIKRLIDNIEE